MRFLTCAAVVFAVACQSPFEPTMAPDMGDAEDSGQGAPLDLGAGLNDGGIAADGGLKSGLRLVGMWGGLGTEPGQFIEPSSVELDSAGTVIVAGHEDRVQRFSQDGALLEIFGEPGEGDGQFNHPHGLAVDRVRGDLIYVGDQENGRLQVFTREGDFVRAWGDDGFRHIHDVGIDPLTGDVFVGDVELSTVRKFSALGELIAEFGGPGAGPGEFSRVWGVSTDSAGNVYVADTNNRRIQKLDREGNFLEEWRNAGGTAFLKPTGVFVDATDIIYVCDSIDETIVLFDTSGNVLERWDLRSIVGERTEPEDIVLDAERRHVFIAEVFGHRVIHLTRESRSRSRSSLSVDCVQGERRLVCHDEKSGSAIGSVDLFL